MISVSKPVLIIGTVILVAVLYQYIGEAAIGGLLALFLGGKKGNQAKIAVAESERDEHEQAEGEKISESVLKQKEADELQSEVDVLADVLNDSEDETDPNHNTTFTIK